MHERPGLSGSILDKYELLEKVGEGGMAEVYRARHVTLGRVVAIKVLHPHLSNVERNRLRFEREARAIESLQHDNILRIFDYSGRESRTAFIVTEFIDGMTLKELLGRENRLPSEVAAVIGIALCSALEYAHARHIIHRDIKPENVMIRADGVIKLMDFGIARVLDESSMTLTGGLVGSPAYMSPEQASDQELDHRTDLFSLGTLLYRTVTGHLPFTGSSAPVILRNILEGHYVDPLDLEPALAPELVEVLQKTLSRNPEDRYASAAETEEALKEVLKASEIRVGPETLQAFLNDPAGYRAELKQTLCLRLPEVGKALIASGQNMAAMKVFNRVLVLDETNQQVRDQIARLYQEDTSLWKTRRGLLLGGGALLAAGLAVGFWGLLALQDPLPEQAGEQASLLPGQSGPGRQAQAGTAVFPAAGPSAGTESGPAGSRIGNPGRPAGEGVSLAGADGAAGGSRSGGEQATPAQQVPPPPRAPDPALSAGVKSRGDEVAGRPLRQQRMTEPLTRLDARLPAEPGERKGAEGAVSVRTPDDRDVSRSGVKKVDLTPALFQPSANYQADLFINGVSYGNLGLLKGPLSLNPGSYRLRLVNQSCEPLEESILLTAGSILEKRFELKGCQAEGSP